MVNMAAKMTRQQKRDRIDIASLAISAASLGVGIAALCLNEKKEEGKMANRIDSSKYTNRKDLKKAYAKEIKQMAVSDVGYTGTVIVLNEKGQQVSYGLVPLDAYASKSTRTNNTKAANAARSTGQASRSTRSSNASKNIRQASKSTRSGNAKTDGRSWVAMEINARTGGSRQAIVCSSKEEARSRALDMKAAHRSNSQQCRDCVQGYAQMDTSKTIDVARWFSGKAGKVYEVRSWDSRMR